MRLLLNRQGFGRIPDPGPGIAAATTMRSSMGKLTVKRTRLPTCGNIAESFHLLSEKFQTVLSLGTGQPGM
jgi:hypothetical protein